MSPDELVERCLAGEQSAWSALVDQYAGLVYAIARSYRLDDAACDDVAQSVFTALVRKLPDLRESRALPGWLTVTATRTCWRMKARDQRPGGGEVAAEPAAPPHDDRLATLEQAQRVREGLSELGGRCQQLLTMLFWAETEPDYRAISEALGMPIGSIGPTRTRCLVKLARILGPPE